MVIRVCVAVFLSEFFAYEVFCNFDFLCFISFKCNECTLWAKLITILLNGGFKPIKILIRLAYFQCSNKVHTV